MIFFLSYNSINLIFWRGIVQLYIFLVFFVAKSIPVHCIVEQVPSPQNCDHASEMQSSVELDSYAIVPSHTLFSELVRTALFKLGYATSDVLGAKGESISYCFSLLRCIFYNDYIIDINVNYSNGLHFLL